ncbi:hypothetical protein Droror1_Dr00027169 [Drosera rotundifolia]
MGIKVCVVEEDVLLDSRCPVVVWWWSSRLTVLNSWGKIIRDLKVSLNFSIWFGFCDGRSSVWFRGYEFGLGKTLCCSLMTKGKCLVWAQRIMAKLDMCRKFTSALAVDVLVSNG